MPSLNQHLNTENETIALFKALQKLNPELARACFGMVKTQMAKNGEFALCLSYIMDFQAEFDKLRADRAAGLARDSKSFRDHSRNRFDIESGQLAEILEGAGRKADAESIRSQAAEVVGGAE